MTSPLKSLSFGSKLACSLLMLVVGLISTSGCASKDVLDTKYGKVNEKPRSINSTSLLAKRLKDDGYDVTVRNRISPKINEFNIVFWFPETNRCPAEGATEAIEEWMADGYQSRTLVYVGGDYRADEDYYRAIHKQLPPELQTENRRLLSEAQLATQQRKSPWNDNAWSGSTNTTCDWFDLEAIKRRKSDQLGGPMVVDADIDVAPKLPIEMIMTPKDIGEYGRWTMTPLLTVDGQDMVYKLEEDNYYGGKNRIIVVQNASFLVNFAAVDTNKQALADRLIDTATTTPDGYIESSVLFLESESAIPIRSTDFVNNNLWAWIAEKPLCYIVPHALLWGVLYCFVYFPIFGRPKHLPKRSTTSFRNHINAIAKQLSKSSGKADARRTIKHYQESVSGSNKTNS